MDFLNISLLLASATGYFPTTRSYNLAYPNIPIRIRHLILPGLITLYIHLDYLDFILRHYDSNVSLSEKLQFYFMGMIYYGYDASLRAFMLIHGSTLCNLIRKLRLTKEELQKGLIERPRVSHGTIFRTLTFLIVGLHFIHIPIRITDWWETNSRKNADAFYVLPKPEVLRLPLFLFPEFVGLIARSFALVLVTYVGLDLIEVHEIVLTKLIRGSESSNKLFMKKAEMNSSGDLDPIVQCIIPKDETLGKEMIGYLRRLEGFFKEFSLIIGGYATMIISFAVGILICEIMALCSPKLTGGSMKNTLAGMMGSLFGIAVICLVTSMGQKIQNQVTKGQRKMRWIKINANSAEEESQSIYKRSCIDWMTSFEWKFTGWGLFEINLSLIPGTATAIFSFIIFNLQLEISETRGTI